MTSASGGFTCTLVRETIVDTDPERPCWNVSSEALPDATVVTVVIDKVEVVTERVEVRFGQALEPQYFIRSLLTHIVWRRKERRIFKLREARIVKMAEYSSAVRDAGAAQFKLGHHVAARRKLARVRFAVGELKIVGNASMGKAGKHFGGVLRRWDDVDDDSVGMRVERAGARG